jgi:hypothetical protein
VLLADNIMVSVPTPTSKGYACNRAHQLETAQHSEVWLWGVQFLPSIRMMKLPGRLQAASRLSVGGLMFGHACGCCETITLV